MKSAEKTKNCRGRCQRPAPRFGKQTVSSTTLFVLLLFASSAFAKDCCWIDTKTGKQVGTAPLSGINFGGSIDGSGAAQVDRVDRNHAHNPKTGQNFAREPGGCWIDTKTGKEVGTAPLSGVNFGGSIDGSGAAQVDRVDRNHAHNPKTGQNFVRVPCPEPAAVAPAPPEKPKEQPNPLGKILQGVSVGVGVSGGRTVGHDDHRVSDHKHTSSTTKKLPAGCKCHPCTCSPCRCGG
jgi:hypothetical protein